MSNTPSVKNQFISEDQKDFEDTNSSSVQGKEGGDSARVSEVETPTSEGEAIFSATQEQTETTENSLPDLLGDVFPAGGKPGAEQDAFSLGLDKSVRVPLQEGESKRRTVVSALEQERLAKQDGVDNNVAEPISKHTSRTRINVNSPLHQGSPVTDDKVSYSELKNRMGGKATRENRISLPPGFRLLEYNIESTLGIGGFGISYLAHDTNLNAKVAIKEYLPSDIAIRDENSPEVLPKSDTDVDDYQTGLNRFLLECRTLATFKHPNIVRVTRFFECYGTAYMVMEFEHGESLSAWMKRYRANNELPLSQEKIVEMFEPLIRGLDVVHQGGFAHRDIKPANIYVRDHDGSLVLLDFGAARQSQSADEGLTSIVTPGYAPLEQYHSHGQQGPWSDIYALGGVLYWVLTGQKPVEAAARLENDPQPKLEEICKDQYPPNFLKAIDWALKPSHRERPQNVEEFLPMFLGDMERSRNSSLQLGIDKEKRRLLRWSVGGGVSAVLVGGGIWGGFRLIGNKPLTMLCFIDPMQSDAQVQIRTSLQPMKDVLSKSVNVEIILKTTNRAFVGGGNLEELPDVVFGDPENVGNIIKAHQYVVAGKFRDINAYYLTRPQTQINRFNELSGHSLGVYSRKSSLGPMSLEWLERNSIDLSSLKITEYEDEDTVLLELIAGTVDAVAVSYALQNQAITKHKAKIRQIGRSAPAPGYAVIINPKLPQGVIDSLVKAVQELDDTPAGIEAMKSILLNAVADSAGMRVAQPTEYTFAAEQLKTWRALYPPIETTMANPSTKSSDKDNKDPKNSKDSKDGKDSKEAKDK